MVKFIDVSIVLIHRVDVKPFSLARVHFKGFQVAKVQKKFNSCKYFLLKCHKNSVFFNKMVEKLENKMHNTILCYGLTAIF